MSAKPGAERLIDSQPLEVPGELPGKAIQECHEIPGAEFSSPCRQEDRFQRIAVSAQHAPVLERQPELMRKQSRPSDDLQQVRLELASQPAEERAGQTLAGRAARQRQERAENRLVDVNELVLDDRAEALAVLTLRPVRNDHQRRQCAHAGQR